MLMRERRLTKACYNDGDAAITLASCSTWILLLWTMLICHGRFTAMCFFFIRMAGFLFKVAALLTNCTSTPRTEAR